jgi:hypothetical protein
MDCTVLSTKIVVEGRATLFYPTPRRSGRVDNIASVLAGVAGVQPMLVIYHTSSYATHAGKTGANDFECIDYKLTAAAGSLA